MTFSLSASLPVTEHRQDAGPSPAAEPTLSTSTTITRRWSSTNFTFSFCGSLGLFLKVCLLTESVWADFSSRFLLRILFIWRNTTAVYNLTWDFILTHIRVSAGLYALFGSSYTVYRLLSTWKNSSQTIFQSLNNDNVWFLWRRATNKVSASCDFHICFLETNVISCMKCKEWIHLTHWQTQRQTVSVGVFSVFVVFLTLWWVWPPTETPDWPNWGMLHDLMKLSDWSKRGQAPSWSLHQI